MKKKLLICVMALAAVFAVTGCDKKNNGGETTTTKTPEKKLACTFTEDKDTTKMTFVYEGDKLKKYDYSEQTHKKDEKAAKKAYEELTNEVKEMNTYGGVSARCSYSGTLVSESITITVDSLDEKGKAYYEEVMKEFDGLSYSELKDEFAKTGFTCTEN